MGAPTIGGTTTGSVTEDSGTVISGNLDDVGLGTSNTDDIWSISSGATYGTATINASTGVWSYDLDDANPTVNALDLGDTLTDVFTVYMLDADGRWDTQVVTITINGVMCFASGTMIEAEQGAVLVEDLRPGDLVQTLDHGLQPLRWVGGMRLGPADACSEPTIAPDRDCGGGIGAGYAGGDIKGIPAASGDVGHEDRLLWRCDTTGFGACRAIVGAGRGGTRRSGK